MEYRDPHEKHFEREQEKRQQEPPLTPEGRRAAEDPANTDPLSGEHGAHPVGTGAGAAAGGLAGAAIGTAGGPVGAVVGATIGGVIGGVAGKAVGEALNPTEEDDYWRENYTTREYAEPGRSYDDYQPAYRYGWESKPRYPDRTFDQAEEELRREWPQRRGQSSLEWEHAKRASRDAWERIEQRTGFGSQPIKQTEHKKPR